MKHLLPLLNGRFDCSLVNSLLILEGLGVGVGGGIGPLSLMSRLGLQQQREQGQEQEREAALLTPAGACPPQKHTKSFLSEVRSCQGVTLTKPEIYQCNSKDCCVC